MQKQYCARYVEKFAAISSSRKQSLESFALIIHRISHGLEKTSRGNMTSLRHTDTKRMESPKERSEERKKGLQLFESNQDYLKKKVRRSDEICGQQEKE